MWHANDGMGWWMLYGALLWVVFWAIVIYLVVNLASGSRRDGTREPERAVDIAKRRYAAGEITREEFEQLRDDLTASARREPTRTG